MQADEYYGDDEFGTDNRYEDSDEDSDEDRTSEVKEERQDANEELIQTRSCQNCMMKTLPLLSAVEAVKVRKRMLAKVALKKDKFNYDLIHAPRETIPEFL